MLGAVEFHTFTKDQREVSFADWMKFLRTKPMMCTSVDSFGEAKKTYEQICSFCNCCAADMQKSMDSFFDNVEEASKKMEKKPDAKLP